MKKSINNDRLEDEVVVMQCLLGDFAEDESGQRGLSLWAEICQEYDTRRWCERN